MCRFLLQFLVQVPSPKMAPKKRARMQVNVTAETQVQVFDGEETGEVLFDGYECIAVDGYEDFSRIKIEESQTQPDAEANVQERLQNAELELDAARNRMHDDAVCPPIVPQDG